MTDLDDILEERLIDKNIVVENFHWYVKSPNQNQQLYKPFYCLPKYSEASNPDAKKKKN